MKVFQNLDKFKYEGEHSLFVWIRKIMVNEALMFLRQNHNFLLSLESDHHEIPVQNEALNKMDAEELNDLIMSLPTGYRTVFNLYVVEGYEHKEIAEILGISDNTSRTQLAKAKNKLRIMLQQKEVSNGSYGE
jgi:RNA polymerase sigma-70 factor (ECF subfamily)